MRHLLGSSATYRIALGARRGRKAFLLRSLPPLSGTSKGGERVTKAAGFSVHARDLEVSDLGGAQTGTVSH